MLTGCITKLKPPWKVLFLGTDQYALHILQALHKEYLLRYLPYKFNSPGVVERLEVVTKPSKCEVSQYVERHSGDMKLHRWPEVDIKPGEFDVGVIASFGKLMPKNFIELFPYGILNVHPSLLPKWRGCAPIPYTILAGHTMTGVTIQQIQPHRFDIGPIVNQMEVQVPPNADTLSLGNLLAVKGANLMIDTLKDLAHLEDIEVDQDDRRASYAHKIHQDDPRLLIDWHHDSCRQIDRKFRAFSAFHDIRSYFGSTPVKLRNAVPMADVWMYTLRDRYMASRPGSAVYIKKKDYLVIQCKDGLVGIKEIVVKKTLSAKDFYNGYLSKPHMKYTRFSNEPLHELILSPPKLLSKQLQLDEHKRWHLQLLRMASAIDTSQG